MASQYEQLRKQNIEDNKRILAQLGLLNPFKPLGRVVKNSVKRKRPTSERKEWTPKRPAVEEKENCDTPIRGSRRRSSRLQGKDVQTADELQEEVEKFVEEDESYRPKVQPNRPNVYGPIPGVEVGTVWQTRMEACRAGVHRPPVSGIHGGEEGCYSIALSGGYEDDIDLGECFTYTGEGGRDLKGTKSNPKNLRTAAQSKDQTLTRGNLALYQNVESGHTVRVIRGYKLPSPFAPEDGYRYDGVYTVEKAWFTTGLSGFGVWKFALRRCQDQAPPPWSIVERDSHTDDKIQSEENKAMFENPTTKTNSIEKCKPMKKEDDPTDSSTDQKSESTREQIEESTDKKENDSTNEKNQDSTDEELNGLTSEQHHDDSTNEQQNVPTCEKENGKDKETNECEDMCDLQQQKDSSALEGKDKSEELDCISDTHRQKTASPSSSDSDLEADTGLCPSDSKIESMRSV